MQRAVRYARTNDSISSAQLATMVTLQSALWQRMWEEDDGGRHRCGPGQVAVRSSVLLVVRGNGWQWREWLDDSVPPHCRRFWVHPPTSTTQWATPTDVVDMPASWNAPDIASIDSKT
ncbi:hypothetical protein H310_02151 [Aphanomyces invadans]|uniref:WW domain-containing protein n=1 Tax=Aphanomyces invadans TaxID=157072 RepID=A0A024UN10_9STRA|nr:hypothetical protein H310_02151 [Aphanomyces invadans]ETW07694.1 hypothetical protein H310_02151 [Aphanomyces invadans]|eukprot:XP_008863787.1 hypothetical protein H310_02151 [Aphanomyces invadans]